MKSASVLLSVGRSASRRGGIGATLHRWSLAAAACVAVIACALFLAVKASSDASEQRVAAREPVFAVSGAAGATGEETAFWMLHSDFVDNQQFLVLYVSPSTSRLAPPPGLMRWPAPGEFFLSPALADDSAGSRLKTRYGTYAGTIGFAGLATHTERLVYYRPPNDEPFLRREGLVRISGFGVEPTVLRADQPANTIEGFGKWTARDVYVLLIFVIALPVMLLVLLAARSNAELRDRRLAMLDALGAPPGARAWVLIGEAGLPALLGSAVGWLVCVLLTQMDIRLPLTGYVATSDDISAVRPLLPAVAVTVTAVILALVVIMQLRGAAHRSTTPRQINTRFTNFFRGVFPVALIVAVWGAMTARADAGTRYSIGLIAFLLAVAAVLASLPSVLAAGTARAGEWLARIGRVRHSPGAVVGGRWLQHRPAMVARLCAAFVVGLGLLVQVQVQQEWIIQQTRGMAGGSPSSDAVLKDTLVVLRTGADAQGIQRFIQEIGQDAVLQVSESAGSTVLSGSCRALALLGELRSCVAISTPLQEAYASWSDTGRTVRRGTDISSPRSLITSTPVTDSGSTTGFLVGNPDGAKGLERITAAAYSNLSKPYVSVPGQDWISGGLAGAAVFDWLLLFGGFGLIILILAGALAAAGMFLAQIKTLGVLGTYSSRTRLPLGIAMWNLGIPLIAAGVVGAVVAAFLGLLTLQIRRVGSLSFEVLSSGVGAVTLIAIILTAMCGYTAAQSMQTWQPKSD